MPIFVHTMHFKITHEFNAICTSYRWITYNYIRSRTILWVDTKAFKGKLKFVKGQLNSEWIYEVIVSPKMQAKNYKDFCPTKQTGIVAKKIAYSHQKKVLRSLFVW